MTSHDGAAPDPRRVPVMFDRIVPCYDRMNRLMTLGRDGAWRRAAVQAVAPTPGLRALDIGCGTGDLTREMARAGARLVVGLDPVPQMLSAASGKLGDLGRIALVQGDGIHLPFPDASFDCVVSAFVMRNMPDLTAALRESRRVLRTGGRLGVLEMTPCTVPIIAPIFRLYFHRIVPLIGALVAGDRAAYTYLPRSVDRFPNARDLAAAIADVGFTRIRWRRFMLGTVALHVAER